MEQDKGDIQQYPLIRDIKLREYLNDPKQWCMDTDTLENALQELYASAFIHGTEYGRANSLGENNEV